MMRNRRRHASFIPIGLLLLFVLACLTSRGFSVLVLNRLSLPAMRALHQLTAPLPFPLAEPLTLAIAALALGALAAAFVRAVRLRKAAPLLGWLRGVGRTALVLLGALAALWLPACGAKPESLPPMPDAEQVAWLCGDLIDALNRGMADFPAPADALREAVCVAQLPGDTPDAAGTVKAARYPEWMRAASISGLFAPLTGEVLIDATAPAPLIPFTAVHELTHLSGVADEGAANIAAWERCLDAGGAFADSARLWALRYAMGLLYEADAHAWQAAYAKMKDPLMQVYQQIGGDIAASRRTLPGAAFLARVRGDYAALVGYLVETMVP